MKEELRRSSSANNLMPSVHSSDGWQRLWQVNPKLPLQSGHQNFRPELFVVACCVAGLERFTASLESVAFVSGSWLIRATFRVFERPVGRNDNHMMTDPIADMLTRIRNAVRVERPTVDVPFSKVKRGLADVLKKEGFIWDWREVESTPAPMLQLELKYGPNGERLIRHIKRISTPGRRVYSRSARLRPILNGLGISILSTSSCVVSDREARQRKLGGEVLCELW